MTELKRKAEIFKKEKVREEMNFSREKQFLSEQLRAVRTALKASQMECDLVKKELDMEVGHGLKLCKCLIQLCTFPYQTTTTEAGQYAWV